MPVLTPSRRRTAALIAVVAGAYGAGALTAPAVEVAPERTPLATDTAMQALTTGTAGPAQAREFIDALDDRWAAYFDPAEYARFEQAIDGRYTGVGLFLRRDPAGHVYVASVQEQSPAATAGLAVGDRLTAVNADPLAASSVTAATTALRGEAGTQVSVTVERNSAPLTVDMRRVVMTSEDVSSIRLHDDVVKISVTAFTRGVGKKVREAVKAADGSGIVLDLRGNPGGLLHEAVEVASAFLDGGPVVTFVPHGQAPQSLTAIGTRATAAPVVVLVDGGTASAAEVVAAALQDRGRAAIIGSQTFGKGTVQQPTRVAGGGGVEYTVGTYLTPLRRPVDGVGISPDIQVDRGSSPSVALTRAVAVLTGLLADARTAGRG